MLILRDVSGGIDLFFCPKKLSRRVPRTGLPENIMESFGRHFWTTSLTFQLPNIINIHNMLTARNWTLYTARHNVINKSPDYNVHGFACIFVDVLHRERGCENSLRHSTSLLVFGILRQCSPMFLATVSLPTLTITF